MSEPFILITTPGKHLQATLHYRREQVGQISILRPGRIFVENRDGRKDCFRSIELCAHFCGVPTSEKIKLEWQVEQWQTHIG